MTLSAVLNNFNNIDTMLEAKNKEVSANGFSGVLEEKMSSEPLTLGDIKNSSSEKENKFADFKKFLDDTTEEVNAETSLDLTLERNISVSEENAVNEEELDAKAEALINEAAVPIQTLESVNQPTTSDLNQGNASAVIKTAPQIEFAKPVDIDAEMESSEVQDLQLDEEMLKELNIESVKAETDASGGDSSLMNRQTPEEQGIKIMLHQEGLNKTDSFEVQASQQSAKPTEVAPGKIIEQVTKHLETLQNNSKVSIVLNPESLGKVTIQLVKSPEGLSAQFTTATQEARNILMKGLDGLKETLTAHGVGVDNVSIKVNDTQKSEYNSDWTDREGSRGGNKEQKHSSRDEKEKGLFEKTMNKTADK